MSYDELVEASFWGRFSKKVSEKILAARNCGRFTPEDANARGMRFVKAEAGFILEGSAVWIFWLVDESDGMVVDAKFQAFGSSLLIVSAETLCELVVGKNYDQARRITLDLIEKHLRDLPETAAFPKDAFFQLEIVIEALQTAAQQCEDILLSAAYISPVPKTEGGEGWPDWQLLSHEKKLAVIEKVLNEEVRPYIELDEGGIEIQELINDKELIIAYKGACTSCFSSIGATLSTIQQIVQAKIHPDLIVTPNMDALQF